jgi:hypothetical protein
MKNLFFRPAEEALFKSWYHLEKDSIDTILPSFPGRTVSVRHDWTYYTVTNSAVNDSSGLSASSTSRRIPFVRRVWTRHSAWVVRPKWRPWWTSGSVSALGRGLVYRSNMYTIVHELTVSSLAQDGEHCPENAALTWDHFHQTSSRTAQI